MESIRIPFDSVDYTVQPQFIQDDKLALRVHSFGANSIPYTYPRNSGDTALYKFIEDDIDMGIHQITIFDNEGRKIADAQPGLREIEKNILKKFRQRVNNERFWTNVLNVSSDKTKLKDKLKSQTDERQFYFKNYSQADAKKPEVVTKYFGLQRDSDQQLFLFTQYYNSKDSQAKKNAVIEAGFIAGYSKVKISIWKANVNDIRTRYPRAFVFTLERNTFSDFNPIVKGRNTRAMIPFKIPLIHASVYVNRNGRVLKLEGLWKSLYGQLRYYAAGKRAPGRLTLAVVREVVLFLRGNGFPQLEILSMNALVGTKRVFQEAGINIYTPNFGGMINPKTMRYNYPGLEDEPHYVHLNEEFFTKVEQWYNRNPLQIQQSIVECSNCSNKATLICIQCKTTYCSAECK